MALLLSANMVAIAAVLSVMADALRLLVGGPQLLYVLLFGALCVVTQIFMPYARYVAVLKWTTLSLFAYFGAVLMVEVAWREVAATILFPPFTLETRYVTTMVAIFGVALSPYLLFWQASQEVEDQRVKPRREPLARAPEQAPQALGRIRLDTYVGMAVASLVGLAIMITAGTTLHPHGITEVQTSAQAAEALRPVAGDFAFAIFAIGIIGTGLLAIPVLAGSVAYALGETRQWPVGLARAPLEARSFYGTLAIATFAGVAINFIGLDPIPGAVLERRDQRDRRGPRAGDHDVARRPAPRHGRAHDRLPLKIGGWMATAVMAASILAMGVMAALALARRSSCIGAVP